METVAITVAASNDGLVLDTETLTITEAGTMTGKFRSGAVSINDTVVWGVKTEGEYRSKVTPTEFWSLTAVATVLLIFIFYILFRRSSRTIIKKV